MTTINLARRVDALELRSQPARVIVCTCSLPGGNHTPDCPAANASDNDTVWLLAWPDDEPARPGPVIRMQWDDDA